MRAIHTYWRLMLAVTLLALQASVLAVGLFAPRVSPGYRALFIDHTMMTVPYDDHTFIWPGPDLVPETGIRPGSPIAQNS
jgi:hypothetical protein